MARSVARETGHAGGQHRFVECLDDAEMNQCRHDCRPNCGDDRHDRTPPGMEHPARRCGFDDLLGHQREEQRHGDVVDGKRHRVGQAVIALGGRIDPHQGNQGAEGQQKQVLASELRETRKRGAPDACLAHRDCLWMTPESTVVPVRETA